MYHTLPPLKKKFDSITDELDDHSQKIIKRAFEFAQEAHKGQLRKSGNPYFIHPLRVSICLWEQYHDFELTVAGILHDVVEDCVDIDIADIYKIFGNKIGFLVDAVSKGENHFYGNPQRKIKSKINRLLWAGMQDVRALVLKLADRSDNLSTIHRLKEHKQVRMAFETQAIFQPLREILQLDKGSRDINEVAKNLEKFLIKGKIKTPLAFKKYLYRQSYKDFSNKIYNLVYDDTDKIIWELDNKEYYEELCQNKEFSQSHEIISIWSDGQKFKIRFLFKKGYAPVSCPRAKLKIFSCQK